MSDVRLVQLGFQQLTSMTSAKTLTLPTTAPFPTKAIIRALTQGVMWRDDGTAPTASIGMPLLPADPPFEYTGDLAAIQFVQLTSGAVLNVSLYGIVG